MSDSDLNPAKALWQAVTKGAIDLLKKHRIFRFLVACFGILALVIGLPAAIFWNVPLLSWLDGKDVAIPLLAAGSYALGIFYMSRNIG